MGQTMLGWTTVSGTAEVPNIIRSYVALLDRTGMILYAGGFWWGGLFHDYEKFHGRMIARTLSVGTPEVTAKVTLEDLQNIPDGFFDAEADGGDSQPLRTGFIDETSLRKNLLPMSPIVWPAVQDGSLQGNVTAKIVVDRAGTVREVEPVISENERVNDTGRRAISALRFKPFVVNGVPVQVMSQITIPFKTTRPGGL
jgi:hypothetical protein